MDDRRAWFTRLEHLVFGILALVVLGAFDAASVIREWLDSVETLGRDFTDWRLFERAGRAVDEAGP